VDISLVKIKNSGMLVYHKENAKIDTSALRAVTW